MSSCYVTELLNTGKKREREISPLQYNTISHFANVHMYPPILLRNHSFGNPIRLVGLIKMCLNEAYSRVWVGKHLSGRFPIKNGLKQGDAFMPLLLNFTLECAI